MTSNPIRAVLFDMGGTLEDLYYDAAIQRAATCGLRDLMAERGLNPGSDLDLQVAVLSGMKAYQAWRQQSEIELPPERVWTEYILTDHGLSRERLIEAAEDITYFYETHYQVRSLRPEAPATLEALHKKGLRLAVISNIISRRLVPCNLAEYGIAHYFGPVVTSSSFGWRKPNVRIFAEAARLLQLPPAACAYVGDTVSRDVIGARRAGYGLVIQIKSFLTDQADCELGAGLPHGQDFMPDAVVNDLMQVVDLISTTRERPGDH